jgi:DHA1 family multidrug resistance protein-like MFS transporter
MIFAGSCTLLGFFLPETFVPVLLAQKAKRLRKADPEKNKEIYAESERVNWAPSAVLDRTYDLSPFQDALGRTDLAAFDDLSLSHPWCYVRKYVSSSRRPSARISDHRSCRAVFQARPVIFIGIGIGAVLASIVNLWFLRSYPLLEQWYGGASLLGHGCRLPPGNRYSVAGSAGAPRTTRVYLSGSPG